MRSEGRPSYMQPEALTTIGVTLSMVASELVVRGDFEAAKVLALTAEAFPQTIDLIARIREVAVAHGWVDGGPDSLVKFLASRLHA